MKIKVLAILFFFFCISISAYCQKTKLDSLWEGKSIHDTTKVIFILDEGDANLYELPDTAQYYFNWAIEIIDNALSNSSLEVQTVKTLQNLKSQAIREIGNVFYLKGNYNGAIENYLKSLKIAEDIGNKKSMADCYGNIGNIHVNLSNFDKAIEYFLYSLKIFEELGNKDRISSCYNNIGVIYYYKNDYDKSVEYYQKALRIFEELGEKNRISECYGNIGAILLNKGDYNGAIEYHHKSLKIFEELNDTNGKATVYGGMAAMYIILADSIAETPAERIKQLNKAIDYGQKSISLARKLKALPLASFAAQNLMIAYKKTGNFEKSTKFAEIFIAIKDSMFSDEKTNALADVQAKYEANKKQQEIEKQQLVIQNKEIEYSRQRIKLNLFISGSVLLTLLVLVILYVYRQKYKSSTIISEKNALLEQLNEEINATSEALKGQNERLISQNIEIETQKNDLANIAWELQDKNQEVEAQRALVDSQNKEITDSIVYAQRIQSALIPSQQALAELFPNHFVLFKPKSIVSGDFYWATKVKRWTVFCVADCTGHGVPGAFMSMLGVSFLNEIVRKDEVVDAADILNQIRSHIISSLKEECSNYIQVDGMDMALCVLDNHTLKLQFAGANLPCWIIQSNNNSNIDLERKPSISEKIEINAMPNSKTLIELLPNRMPLSLYQRMSPFESIFFQLYEGDTIYLLSDGFQDQFGGPEGKKFQTKQLKEAISNLSSLPLTTQHQFLNDIFEDWKKDKIQIDDVTVMGVKI